ncbi:methyltransferase domain-containing protein [Colletotrichum tofieldiae]|uniref:Methyltransferase domain-containing protein n=1 Tax=Colletotrichum tofieldiae TaxID=708197 RepID=A0A161WJR9_9PEZI|nr:methyltransferase domain-containing protein [Colletotrichum tofieldiae]
MTDSSQNPPVPALALRSETASPVGEPSTGLNVAPEAVTNVESEVGPDALEVDDAASLNEAASNIDDQISTYTASLSSSVLDYPTENGRRYHAFRAGLGYPVILHVTDNKIAYLAPNDEVTFAHKRACDLTMLTDSFSEMDRLDFNHMLIMKTIGRKLFLAPVPQETTHRILDIGTGTGIWAIEAADVFPNAEILGNDLSAIQPSWVPPNIKFEIDDVESPWVNESKYDFIFCRYMAASITDWPKLIQNIYDNLNPGGWVEFQDYDISFHSDDGSLTDKHHTDKWSKLLLQACEMAGRDPCPGPKLEGWVKSTGFTDVVHQQFKIPVGPWPKDPHYRDIGMTNLIQLLDGLEGFSLRTFCGIHGWTKEEVFVMLAHVRKELKTVGFHAYSAIHVVYAQKPQDERSPSIDP